LVLPLAKKLLLVLELKEKENLRWINLTIKRKNLKNGNGESENDTKIRLGNLAFALEGKEDEIKDTFGSCGEIKNVEMITRKDGSFAGVALIEFEDKAGAAKAIERDGEEFYSRNLKITYYKAETPRKPYQSGPKPEGCTTIFIGGLKYEITEEEVRDFFSNCGKIADIRWQKGDFTGIGWVEFEDTSSVDEALKLNGKMLLGRAIRVDFATPRKSRDY